MFFFFQAEDGIRDLTVTGVQTCALPISAADRVYVGYRSVACWRELVPDGVWGPNDTCGYRIGRLGCGSRTVFRIREGTACQRDVDRVRKVVIRRGGGYHHERGQCYRRRGN